MGLIGNGIYYLPRQSCLGGASVVAHCAVSRPMWKAIQHRMLFDKDHLSFPSGTYQSAICLPMKYGGMGMRVTAAGTTQADIQAWGTVDGSMSGSGSVTSAALTGLKDAPCTMTGSGQMTGSVRGTGSMTCLVSIGSQPSAFDIAQAVLNALASQYNIPGTIGAKINSASAAGDPWTAELPGSYPAGSAGAILGNSGSSTGSGLTLAQFLALK